MKSFREYLTDGKLNEAYKQEELNEAFSIESLIDKLKKHINEEAKKLDIKDFEMSINGDLNKGWDVRVKYTVKTAYKTSAPLSNLVDKNKFLVKMFYFIGDSFYNSALGVQASPDNKYNGKHWEMLKFKLKPEQIGNITRSSAIIFGEMSKEDLKILKSEGKKILDVLNELV